jgi:hypothetical protein
MTIVTVDFFLTFGKIFHETSVPHVFCSSTVWGHDYFLCIRLVASIKSLFNRELLGGRGSRRCLMAPFYPLSDAYANSIVHRL